MSEASLRGQEFEARIAKLLRRAGFKAYRDRRSGAGDFFKADIVAPGFNFHIEAKSQERINLREWWQQTIRGAGYKGPVLVVDQGGFDDLAVMRLTDFINLVETIDQDSRALTELRSRNG